MAASTMFPSPRATPPSALDTVPARRSLLATLIIGDAPAPHPAPSTRASQSARQLLYALQGARAMRPQGTSCHSSRVCHPSRRRVPERRSAASACAPHLATASPPRSQDEPCALLSAASPQLRRRRFARADPRARTGRIFVRLARWLRHVHSWNYELHYEQVTHSVLLIVYYELHSLHSCHYELWCGANSKNAHS